MLSYLQRLLLFGFFTFALLVVAIGQGELAFAQQGWLDSVNDHELAAEAEQKGDAKRGAAIFFRAEMACAKCHQPQDGRRLGPDLAEKREVTFLHLVQSIRNPSAVIREGFAQQLLQLVDGRQLTGIVASSDDQFLYLDRIEEPGKPLEIAVADIDQQKQVAESSMPKGLVNLLNNRQEFLDLVQYLSEIAEDGPARAAQLRPAYADMVALPLPAYEQDLDHQQLIANSGSDVLKQGEQIYSLICSTCHGDRQQEGSMPTSLKFASGKFKRGSDPYSMYLTLTHGYGLMMPQRNLVPRQKYAVIHYIRETYLKSDNPSQYFQVDDTYLTGLPAGSQIGPEPILPTPWTEMDYGPSFFNTIQVPNQQGQEQNIAQKGLTIRLDPGPGGVGRGSYWLMYDHDTMRVAGIWRNGFLDYHGVHFNGMHAQHPKVTGEVLYQLADGPGWAGPEGQEYNAERVVGRDGRRYGPVPRSWAQYRGLYRFGDRSLVDYTVHQTNVLESPELVASQDQVSIVRHFQFGPRDHELVTRLVKMDADSEVVDGVWLQAPPAAAQSNAGFDGQIYWQHAVTEQELESFQSGFDFRARVKTQQDGTLLALTQSQKQWLPNGRSFFVRGGRLGFDIGWVGAVTGKTHVADGKWHNVRLQWKAESGETKIWLDGEEDGSGVLRIKEPLMTPVFRLGFTNENFPAKSRFVGQLDDVELKSLEPNGEQLTLSWSEKGHGQWERESGLEALPRPWRFATAIGGDANSLVGEMRVRNDYLEWVVPAGHEPLAARLVVGVSDVELDRVRVVEGLKEVPQHDLQAWTHGGPANWPTIVNASVQETLRSGGFVQDTIGIPETNPWNARLRLTGIDFIPNSDDAMVCSWDGGVWRVFNISGAAGDTVRWQRVAAGLFQPLGIKYRDGELFVTCRDQLVQLHDLNGDGEMDWYQCFNNDHQVTEHFHEFAMGLQTDQEGNFYYAKSARHALKAIVPHHGTLLRVSRDGKTTEILANGFRAANGVCLNPDGSFVVTDQEGHWNPKNRINWVRPGQFYGNMFGYHDVTDESDDAMTPPLCWITNEFDRSPAELLWVDSESWGPLNGQLLNLSYGYGKAYIVPFEEKQGQKQGGMCAFDLPAFPTGVMRGRFHPGDGALYCCGMYAWSSTQQKPGGLYRLRPSGEPFHLPVNLETDPGQVRVTFSEPLDRDSVRPENFAIQAWDLKRTANYGSQHYNQRTWNVEKAELLDDGKTVVLWVPELSPTWGMEIAFSLRDKEGNEFQNRIHNSIYHLED